MSMTYHYRLIDCGGRSLLSMSRHISYRWIAWSNAGTYVELGGYKLFLSSIGLRKLDPSYTYIYGIRG